MLARKPFAFAGAAVLAIAAGVTGIYLSHYLEIAAGAAIALAAVAVPVAAGVVSSSHSNVTSAGTDSDGTPLSTTVMTWSQPALLPDASSAVHVRVITLAWSHVPADTLSLYVTPGLASHASAAVAVPAVAGLVVFALEQDYL